MAKKAYRPGAKAYAKIVAHYEAELEESYKIRIDDRKGHDEAITAMKADIKKIEVTRDTACEITARHLEKIKELERTLAGTKNALELAVFELESYQSLLVTMVHESAVRRLRAKKLGTEGEVKA